MASKFQGNTDEGAERLLAVVGMPTKGEGQEICELGGKSNSSVKLK